MLFVDEALAFPVHFNSDMSAALPPDEDARLEELERYAILDTLPEQQYDDLTFLASQLCDVPISLVSLVANDRQWFKSQVGLDVPQTPRELSFCAHAILGSGVFEIPDATLDARFRDNPLVTGEPHIRFYAGAPLITPEGHRLGTLCVVDREPRRLSEPHKHALEIMARQVMSQMELWRTVKRLEIVDAARRATLARAEAAFAQLEQSEKRFQQFMDNSPIMAFIKDAAGRYVYLNGPMERTFGVSLSESQRLTDFDWWSHEVAQSIRDHDNEVINSGETRQFVEEAPTPDGEMRSWLVFKFPLRSAPTTVGDDSGSVFLGGVGLDITEMQRAARLKNEFVSVVSHELRTPLTAIKGAIGLLQGGAAGELPDRASSMIDIAHKNAERLMLLINDLLDIEKIQGGQMRFEMKPLHVGDLLRSAHEANAPYAQTLDVTLLLDFVDEAVGQLWIRGDELRLQQVLSNLLSNGVKWSSPAGTVRLRARVMNGNLRVEVEDEGAGVPVDFVPRLFERFAQADSSATRKQGGTGLGLAISRAIVEMHGGRIDYLAPDENRGTIFYFDLPLELED